MHHRILSLVILGLHTVGVITADHPDWENEKVIGRNKEAAHTWGIPYPDRKSALANKRTTSPWFQSLNGDWKFHWSPSPEKRPEEFYQVDFDDSQWKLIPVPSNWQTEGFAIPLYSNITYPFEKDAPRVTTPPKDSSWTQAKWPN
ncbi:MAG: sugar-binding domain-containing protein, partial [Planctomycetota bacterium]